jgi:hypothetical protein
VPARDRLICILVGIVVMAVIDMALWPVFTRSALRAKFASILHHLAALQQLAAKGDDEEKRRQAFAIHREVAEAMALQEELIFEPAAGDTDADLERRLVLRVLNRLQEIFLDVLDTARKRALLQLSALPPLVQTEIRHMDAKIVAKLEALAATLDAPATPTHVGVDAALAHLEKTLRTTPGIADRQHPVQAYAAVVHRLAASLDALEMEMRAALTSAPEIAPQPPKLLRSSAI